MQIIYTTTSKWMEIKVRLMNKFLNQKFVEGKL